MEKLDDDFGNSNLTERLERVLAGEGTCGFVVVFDDETTTFFVHNCNTSMMRDALLGFARDLAAYQGGGE